MLNCDCQKLREEMGLARFCKSGKCPVRERLSFRDGNNESGSSGLRSRPLTYFIIYRHFMTESNLEIENKIAELEALMNDGNFGMTKIRHRR